MTNYTFLFCCLVVGFAACDVTHGRVVRGHAAVDTLDFPFGRLDTWSGDTVFMHASGVASPWPDSLHHTFLRFFNKRLQWLGREGEPILGIAVVRLVIDTSGRCTAADYDTAVSDSLVARELMRVALLMNRQPNAVLLLQPTRIGGRPVVSRVETRVLYERTDAKPPAPAGFKPDIVSVGYPSVR